MKGHPMLHAVVRLLLAAMLALPAWAVAATVEYIHTDALGSPVAVTNASGQVIERREYEPYGRQLVPTALSNGPGYTGHVSDAATGLTYMQQRYYDPIIGRFLSVDPVTAYSSPGVNFNRYWYANNNPYKFVDPDGRYGRGAGFTDKEWNKFDRAQKGMAKDLEKAAGKITKALETGKGLKGVTKAFEKTFGKGSGTAENMSKVASSMTDMAGALRDDGSKGFMATGMSGADFAANPQLGADAMAAAPRGTTTMMVNLGHSSFGSQSMLGWAVGHESGHNFGMSHGQVNGVTAYKFGSPAQQAAFGNLPQSDPAAALTNPDTVLDFAR